MPLLPLPISRREVTDNEAKLQRIDDAVARRGPAPEPDAAPAHREFGEDLGIVGPTVAPDADPSMVKRHGLDDAPKLTLAAADRPPPTDEEIQAARSRPLPTEEEVQAARSKPRELHTAGQIQPGLDVQADPAAVRAGIAATAPGAPMPETEKIPDQHIENVAKAAADANTDKLQGFGGWAENQIRAYLRRAYAISPTLAEMASYEPDRFAQVAHNGAALENMVSGPPTKEELDYFRANGLPVPDRVEHHGMLGVALKKAFVGAGAQLYQAWKDLADLTGRHPGPHTPAEIGAEKSRAGNLDYLKNYTTTLELLPIDGRGSVLAGGLDIAAGFVPTAIELGLAPWAAVPTLALHGYGALRLAGADPGWAMGGGLAVGLIGSTLGARFISGLAGKAAAQDGVGAFAAQLQREFVQASFGKLALTHARSGYLMMAGMNAASEFALMGDQYFGKGQKIDASQWVQLARRVFVDPLAALPFAAVGATGEFYAQKGRMLAAHGDNMTLHIMSDLIQSASNPDAAAQVLQEVVTRRRVMRQLETAAGVAADRGGPAFLDLNRAANQHRDALTLMVSAPEFRRAAEKMGVAPEDLQRRILFNWKVGFSDAEVLGIPLEAPIRTLAHELKDSIDGMSLHQDTPSLAAAKKEPKIEAPPELEEWYKKREEEIKKTGGLEAVLPTKQPPGAKPGDKNAETQEAQPLPESPTPAPKKIQSALQDDAVRTVESLPRAQLYSGVFRDQVSSAREVFAKEKDPALRAQAADSWERARAAEEARKVAAKEYDKIQSGISKLVGQKARDKAYAGGPMFGQAYDSILNNDPAKLSEALKALPEDALSVDHDDLLKAASHDNIDDAPLIDARVVHKALTELQESARVAEDVTYYDGQEHSREAVIDGFAASLAGRKPPGSGGGPFGWAGRQRAAWEAYKLTHHALLQPYGEWGKHRSYWFLQSRNAEDQMVGRHLELTEAPKAIAKLGNEPVNPPSGWRGHPDAAPKFRKDAWRVALNLGNEEDALRFSERSGMTLPEIHDWLDNEVKLTRSEYDHVSSWWQSLKEIMDLHAASKSNMLRSPMMRKTPRAISTPHGDYLGGDAPFAWYEDSQGGPQGEREVRSLGASPQKWANPDPKLLTAQLLDSRSPDTRWDTLKGDVGRLIHDASFGEFNRDTRNMLGDQRFKDVTIGHLGQDWYDRTVDWFNVVQNGSIWDDAQGRDLMDKAFGIGKRLAANAAFNTNIPILAAQPTHFIIAGSRFGAYNPKIWFKGLGYSVIPAGRAEAYSNSEVIPFRTDRYRPKMAQLWAEVTGDQTMLGRAIDKTNIPGMVLQHHVDMFLSNALWHTFKFQALEEGLSLQDAYKQADLRTDQSMPAISILDQSALNRSKIWGAFTLARNFPQAVFNLKVMDKWDTQEEVSARGNIFTGYGGLIGRRLGMTAGLVAGYYLMGHGRSEYEQSLDQEHPGRGTARWLIRTAVPESFLGNPISHTLLKAVAEAFIDEEPNLRNVHLFESPVEGLTAGLLRDIHQASVAGDWQEALFPAFSAFGRATGLLPPALIRSLKGGYQILQPGDFTWAQGASWLTYGPDRRESNIFGGGK